MLLGYLARKRLRKLSPKVIGISGSVGKTSTKEAIAHILSSQFRVLKSDSSYNTDFGIYLTILEEKSGMSSLSSWIKVLFSALKKTYMRVDPIDFLILEMGTDQPGDMQVLLDIIVPDIAVMTRISENHFSEGQFPSLESMFHEDVLLQKSVLAKETGHIFMNVDDVYQKEFIELHKDNSHLHTYSLTQEVGGEEAVQMTKEGLAFMWETLELHAPIVGPWHAEVLLPAIHVARFCGIRDQTIVESCATFRLPAGRMNSIPGKHGETIIDSSYNASPLAVMKAVKLLGTYTGRRIFVFGNMNELGDQSDMLHEEVGTYFPGNVDILLTVGEGPILSTKRAIALGFSADAVHHFKTSDEAALFYETIAHHDDIVLVKGSQNRVRLEKFIKHMMKEPHRASELLVRQSEEWNKK